MSAARHRTYDYQRIGIHLPISEKRSNVTSVSVPVVSILE